MSLFEAISSSVFLSFSFLLTYLIMQRLLAQFEFSNGLEDVVLVSTRLLQFSDAEALQARMCSKATVSARACVCMIKDWEKDEEEEEEDEVEEEEEAKAHHLIDAGLKLGRLCAHGWACGCGGSGALCKSNNGRYAEHPS